MRIAIDAMGGDLAPRETVAGTINAARNWPEVTFLLIGRREAIEQEIDAFPANVQIVHADEVIEASEEPVKAIRRKKDASMAVAARMVRDKEADAMVTCGNTGAFMTAGFMLVGRISGIDRPALAPILPTVDGKGVLVLDAGANVDAKAEHLLQYAMMGSIYSERVLGVAKPRVGLLNIGAEAAKGNELTKQTFPLLERLEGIHFIGNIEAREVTFGVCDVVVTEGFAGNILLKATEGIGEAIIKLLKAAFTENVKTKLAAAILRPQLKQLGKKLDYTEYGGAPLLGINGALIKAHGSSDANAIFHAVRQAVQFVEQNVLKQLQEHQLIKEMEKI
jgi:glycerol-3-phosphate acyltransferase PlsX